MEKSITFKIDGSWLTDFVRKRYWYEGLSYEDSFKLLEACLVPPDSEASDFIYEAISGILTGKKKLVGINEVSVEDDDKSKEYFSFLRRKRKFEMDDNPPEVDNKNDGFIDGHRTVEVKVFDGDRHLHPFEFYDGTTEDYVAIPDSDFTSKMGLISPTGEYYGCTFASHLFLAQHIIERDSGLKKVFDKMFSDRILPEDRSLDFLLNHVGWIALRNPSGGEPKVDLGKYDSEDDLPQRMLDCLWDYRISLRNKE